MFKFLLIPRKEKNVVIFMPVLLMNLIRYVKVKTLT